MVIDDCAGTRYETYVTDELLPLLRSEYGAEGPVTVAGFSAGGAGAVFLALRHPDVFASALAVAGAFTAGNREGDPYRQVRSDDMMIPTEAEHDRVWGPPGSTTRRPTIPRRWSRGWRRHRGRDSILKSGRRIFRR